MTMLSRHILSGIAFLMAMMAGYSPAPAADEGRKNPHHYWQGGYFGPAISLYKLKNDYDPAKPIGVQKLKARGKLIGLVAGYNFSENGALYSLEGDISSGSVFSDDLAYITTLRGRAGIPVNYSLPYVTGGLALAGLKKSAARAPLKVSNTQAGIVIGAGFEQVLANALSGRIEYTYGHFFSNGSAAQPNVRLKHLHMLRASIVVHFND